MIKAAYLALLFLTSQSYAACLNYQPVEIAGALSRETFPGPPNYESVASGDAEETYFFVTLASPECVVQGDNSGLEPAAESVTTIQLVFNWTSAANDYQLLKPYLGSQVICRGTLLGQHTGHHHTPILLTDAKCHAAQPIAPPAA